MRRWLPLLLLALAAPPALAAGKRVVTFFVYVPPVVVTPPPASPPTAAPQAPPAGPPLVLRDGPPSLGAQRELPHVAAARVSCGTCHQTGVRVSSGVALFDAAGRYAPSRRGRPLAEKALWEAVEGGSMPPGNAPPLTPGAREVLRLAWAGR